MYDFKTNFIGNIIKYNMPNILRRESADSELISPTYKSLLLTASALFNNFSSLENINLYNKIYTETNVVSKYTLDSIKNSISLFSKALLETSIENLNSYYSSTLKYSNILRRFLNTDVSTRNKLSELNRSTLRYIDVFDDKNDAYTTCFTIGSYIVLPYIIDNVKMYSGDAIISAYSSENITFTNLSSTTKLPLSEPILIKYNAETTGTSNIISLQCAVTEFITNLIYIRSYGDVQSIRMKLLSRGEIIFDQIQNVSEAIFNFDQTIIDGIIFELQITNFNPTKPVSLEIAEINILSGIKFNRSGIYQTNKVPMSNYLDVDMIRVNAINYAQSAGTNFDIYASVTFDKEYDNLDFFKVDKITGTTFPLSKFTHTESILADNDITTEANTVTCKAIYGTSNSTVVADMYKYNAEDESMRYENAKLLIGTADAYGQGYTVNSIDKNIYENWTKIDNFYRTMILNNEQNITLDIGSNIIKVNNQDVTGIISIPTGISVIDVHQSLFDPTLNGQVQYDNINFALNTNEFIYTDRLYPNNFIYKLAGLPTYDTYNNIKTHIQITNREISGLAIIDLGSPVLPYTVAVMSQSGRSYSLNLSDTPIRPGMFSVLPAAGLVKVYIYDEDDTDIVDISFSPADSSFKPCGLLFNRMASYIDFKAITNMLATYGKFDNTFYSYILERVGEHDVPYILIPSVTYLNTNDTDSHIYHYKLTFNTYTDDYVYVASKLLLSTTNSYLTPIINNLYIHGTQ